MIDFRSDTFTKPDEAMLNAMFTAEVGDDVYGEDPTINKLERLAAGMFEMEDALFCVSGTMTNQIAIKCHTQPGDEVICDQFSHVYIYEGGGISFNSLCSVKPVAGNRGRITAEQVMENINESDIHKPVSRLVSLENTANRGGGSCYNFSEIEKIRQVCFEKDLSLHLDGARLFNALVSKGEKPSQYGKIFDSISICLSKGLGSPVGSLLLGKAAFIKKARRYRKVLGGGIRQGGYLAAAGIYALENNINRLSDDHQHAQRLVNVLKNKDFVGDILPVETNIVIFETVGSLSPEQFVGHLAKHHIRAIAISKTQVRMVFHLGITSSMVDETIQVIEAM